MPPTLTPFLTPSHSGPAAARATAVTTFVSDAPDALDGSFAALLLQGSVPTPLTGERPGVRGQARPAPVETLVGEGSGMQGQSRIQAPTARTTTHVLTPATPTKPATQPPRAARAATPAKPAAPARLTPLAPGARPVSPSTPRTAQRADTVQPTSSATPRAETPMSNNTPIATPPQPVSSSQPTAQQIQEPPLLPPLDIGSLSDHPPQAIENVPLVNDTSQSVETQDIPMWLHPCGRSAELTIAADGHAVQVKVALSGRQGNQAHITLLTDNAAERGALHEDSEQLRHMLHEEGLHLASMTVGAGAGGAPQREAQQQSTDKPRPGWQATTVQVTASTAAERHASTSSAQGVDVFV